MINVSNAFGRETTAKVIMHVKQDGYWDEENQWVGGGYTAGLRFDATCIPASDHIGTHGEVLKPDKYGERYPASMRFHSVLKMPINAVVLHGGIAYKVTKVGDYQDGGFWRAHGQRLNVATFAETTYIISDLTSEETETGSMVRDEESLDSIILYRGSRPVSLLKLLRYVR